MINKIPFSACFKNFEANFKKKMRIRSNCSFKGQYSYFRKIGGNIFSYFCRENILGVKPSRPIFTFFFQSRKYKYGHQQPHYSI